MQRMKQRDNCAGGGFSAISGRVHVVIACGMVIFVSSATAVTGLLVLRYKTEAASFKREASRLKEENLLLDKNILEREQALTLATRQNFQNELIAAQSALREVNEKLAAMIREKAGIENSGIILDSRLKNTTVELTRTLDELKKAREALAGIESQYKIKLDQLAANIAIKDDQILKLQEKNSQQNALAENLKMRHKDVEDLLRKHQMKAVELEKTISSLNKTIGDKETLIARKEVELQARKKEAGTQQPAAAAAKAKAAESESKIASLEREKAQLERQVAESSARLFDQQEELQGLGEKLAFLKKEFSDKETGLLRREDEIRSKSKEIESLKEAVRNLQELAEEVSKSEPLVAQAQIQLEEKVRRLETEKAVLEDRLKRAERAASSTAKGEERDLHLDLNFRVLTETIVKKEEQITAMEAELESLRQEKKSRGGDGGLQEKKLAELEILAKTLTRQLGEYAALISQKDAEVKAGSARIAALMRDVEAQKVSALALQQELADARKKQEKTLQSLTQLLSVNSDSSLKASPPASSDMPFEDEYAPAANTNPGAEAVGGSDVQRRVKELRRRVEVLLESKQR